MSDINFVRNIGVKDITLTNGDLTFTSDQGLVTYSSTTESIRQDVVARLYTFKGEYFLDSEDVGYGTPWIQEILSQKPLSLEKADRVIRSIILNTDGIASVEQLQFNYTRSDRSLDITFIAKTDAGQLVKDNVLIG